MVDSGFHNRTAIQVMRKARKSHPKQMILLDTHYHSDHVLGNGVFDDEGAAVVSHCNCRRRMKAQSPSLLSRYQSRDPRIFNLLGKVRSPCHRSLSKTSFRLVLTRIWKRKLFIPCSSGRKTHNDGDSMVYIPDYRVVFPGDVLWVGYYPNLEDADIRGQVRALKTILRWNPRSIAPGHGPVCRLPEVRRFIRYL